MKNKKYDILSPDGFSIQFDKVFNSLMAAKKAFAEWVKRYEIQGYYSSTNYGRIPLSELEEYCTLIEL